MRFNLTPARTLVATGATLAVLAVALPLSMAATPVTTPPVAGSPGAKVETDAEHLQFLRGIRSTLNGERKKLKEEPIVAGDTHRADALKAMEAAVDAVNSEVVEFEKSHPDVAPAKK